ncbi:MAG: ketoacyl-ACP synthase III [Clostridia bacterium]
MSYSKLNGVRITGMCAAFPKNEEDNRVVAQELGVDDIDKFIDIVGVKRRYVAINRQTSSDLCYESARSILAGMAVDPSTIDALLFVSQTPDYIQPSTACVLHGRLGLQKSALAFDINLGCSGFVYGLSVAASFICGMGLKRVLLLVGDILRKNKTVDPKDTLLFGDVGTATLIEAGDGIIESALFTDGTGYKNLIIPGGGTRRTYQEGDSFLEITKPEMDGESVMAFTITEVPKAFKVFFANNGKQVSDYDYCILHQANKQMIQYIAKKVKIPAEKLPISMDRYGNTNGSSIPVTLADLCEHGVEKEKLSIIASGFGIGLSWGIVSFDIEVKNVLPIIHTDAVFTEGYRGKF